MYKKSLFTYVKDWVKNGVNKVRLSRASSHQEIIIGGQLAVIVVCALLIGHLSMEVVEVSSTYGNRELPIYSVGITEKKIAISFDAAWGAEDFNQIMEVLDKHQVKTTFFMTGEWVEKYPECVKTLVEKGHDLGNHSASHPDMTKLSKSQIREELTTNIKLIEELTGFTPKLFRPPYGYYNNNLIEVCDDLGLSCIEWSVDSLDWKGLTAGEIANRVTSKIRKGSIVLFHNNSDNILDGLKMVLEYFKCNKMQVVPIGKLIYYNNFTINNQGEQIKEDI